MYIDSLLCPDTGLTIDGCDVLYQIFIYYFVLSYLFILLNYISKVMFGFTVLHWELIKYRCFPNLPVLSLSSIYLPVLVYLHLYHLAASKIWRHLVSRHFGGFFGRFGLVCCSTPFFCRSNISLKIFLSI